jgi:Kdo2-lipid IVA lauroyltransferase/acyltransferase
VRYTLVKIMSRIVCNLSDAVSYKLGDWIGNLCWSIVPRRRRAIAVENAISCLGVDRGGATAIVKQSTTRFGRMFLEVLRLPKIKGDLRRYVDIEGREHLDSALAYGRGVVLATSHSGNWELLGSALALEGFPLVAVAKKQTNAEMDRFIVEYRTLVGMHVVYKKGVHTIFRLLKESKVIALLMDQSAGSDGVFVKFFGRPTSTPPGAAALARMQNAPIVPAFITETSKGKHTVIIHPPIWVQKTDDREHDILTTTQQLSDIIEQHIRTYPHEWFWLHNRWKHQPKVTINQLEQTVV